MLASSQSTFYYRCNRRGNCCYQVAACGTSQWSWKVKFAEPFWPSTPPATCCSTLMIWASSAVYEWKTLTGVILQIKTCSQISLHFCLIGAKFWFNAPDLKHLISLINLCCFYLFWSACCTCIRLSTLSWRAVGGLFLGRIACTKTPSTNSCDATRTWKRWPQFFTQASRTWGPVRPYTTWKQVWFSLLLYAQAEKHCRGKRTGGTSVTLQIAGNKRMKMNAAQSPPTNSQ